MEVQTETRPPTPTVPGATTATAVFRGPATSSAGALVYIHASFLPSGQTTWVTTPGSATIRFLGSALLSAQTSNWPASKVLFSRRGQAGFGEVTVIARTGAWPAAGLEVCASLDAAGSTRASLSDQTDDTGASLMLPTDALGRATVYLNPVNYMARGPVQVALRVVPLNYEPAADEADSPCREDPAAITLMEEWQLDGTPLMRSMVYLGAQPPSVSVQGTGGLSTTAVQFQVLQDDLSPASDVVMEFTLEETPDTAAYVTPLETVDTRGIGTGFVTAGDQAGVLRVRATSRAGLEVVTALSDAIPVVGGGG
ncbi:MAG: hypothetical protein HY904_00410 [Deltaproteobacteria bacterium]|nr:hypothetical protein [Deltaproteobacteria bacterium]